MQIFKLKETLKRLEDQAITLCSSLKGADMVCTSAPGPFLHGDRALSLITERLVNIWCDDDQTDARETPVAIGAISASSRVLHLAHQLNSTKDELRHLFGDLREFATGKGVSRSGKDKAFRSFLADVGLGRISLRQVNRHIPILDDTPKKIDFAYSTRGKSITRLSAKQAIDLLIASGMEGDHIDIQMKRLVNLPPEYLLAQVQHLSGYYKSNVRMLDGSRQTFPVFLPVFYKSGRTPVILPEDLCMGRRTIRSRRDIAIMEEAFIPSLRIYKYKDQLLSAGQS